MTTKVEKSIIVNVPISTVYNQWTQFEDFPQFMGGVKSVTQLGDDRMQWVAEIAGIRRQWEARVVQQIPDQKVSWAATSGATNAGEVTFEDAGGGQTNVHLTLEYEPEGLVEKVGDKLNVIENQAESDLEKFKNFIEDEGYATGAWRGTVNEGGAVGTPGVEHAAASQGDSGKAGVSGKAVAAGVGAVAAAAAGVAAAVAGAKKSDDTTTTTTTPVTSTSGTTYSGTSTSGTTYSDSTTTGSTTTGGVGSTEAGLSAGTVSAAGYGESNYSDTGTTGSDYRAAPAGSAPAAPAADDTSAMPHVLTDADIEARTPDTPLLDTDDVDADGTDSRSGRTTPPEPA